MGYQNFPVSAYGSSVGATSVPYVYFSSSSDPSSTNVNFPLGQIWVNQDTYSTWILLSFTTTSGYISANWQQLAEGLGEPIEYITTPDSVDVEPSSGQVLFTAGTGITITGSGDTVTFTSTGAGYTWSLLDSSTTSQSITVGTAYVPTASSLVTFTLPSSPSFGNTFGIVGYGTGGWQLAQNANQTIIFGASSTTVGVSGYLASTIASNSVFLVFLETSGGTDYFKVIQSTGNITVA